MGKRAAKTTETPDSCRGVTEILNRVGDKWTVNVVRHLGVRTMRFSELRKALDGVSQKMLTTTLRQLERDGFVTRTVYPTIPPKVEYELTELGRDLWQPVAALGQWAHDNRSRVEAARIAFDLKSEGPLRKIKRRA
ncbi:MAG: helix-turn-helix domain-containing protein [Alphaproteobacteria bacterium]